MAVQKIPEAGVGRVEQVRLADLQVDTSYQRGLKGTARKIARHLDEAAVGILHVGRRADDSLWVIDGRQRLWALVSKGYQHWSAYVVPSGGPSHEAAIFNLINGGRTQLTAQEIFRSRLEAKDPVAMAVDRAVRSAGLQISFNRAHNIEWPRLRSVSCLYSAAAAHGEAVLSEALRCLARTWPEQSDALRDRLLNPFVRLYCRFHARINPDRMERALKVVPPLKLINESAALGGDGASHCMKMIARQYNKRLRTAESRIGIFAADEEDGEEAA